MRRRCPADSLRTGTSLKPAGQAHALERGRDLVGRGADRRSPERHVLGDREIGVQAVGVAEQADTGAHRLALRRPGRGPSTIAVPRAGGSSPAHSRSSVVLPAPFGPVEQTISPRRTVSVAPASAGKRSRTATTSTS